MHKGLKVLFDEDQHDCLHQPADGTPEYFALRKKCKERIFRVRELFNTDENFSGDDYFQGCIISMHGDCPEDFWQAHSLGLKAVEHHYDGAKKFAAAAFDKWLMYQGKPQKFGSQFVPDGVGLRLWDVDPDTTDKEREDWELPSLEEFRKKVNDMNETFDISKIAMESKPQWLKDAIKRWNAHE
jgi:hypothetical protein